jgi:hypothetical protein
MKKDSLPLKDELRAEYRREDLGEGVRGKYYQAYTKGTNLVLLNPDVAAAFPTAEAVNEALRLLLKLAQDQARLSPRARGRATKAAARP